MPVALRHRRPTGRRSTVAAGVLLLLGLGVAPPAASAEEGPVTGGLRVVDDTVGDGPTRMEFSRSWTVSAGSGRVGGSDRTSTTTGGSATITFVGTTAELRGATGPDHGRARVQVDGGRQDVVDLYSAQRREDVLIARVTGLAPGTHRIRLEVTDQRSPLSSGRRVSVDSVRVGPLPPTSTPTPVPAPAPAPTVPPLAGAGTVGPVTPAVQPPAHRSFVTRTGGDLRLDGKPFRFSGANIYWLGLDDNVRDQQGRPTRPTTWRVDHALDAAKRSGATVVRAHTLGMSVGCPECFSPRRGVYDERALAAADYAVAAAGARGLRLVVPLVDQWRWYHGGMGDFTDRNGFPSQPDRSRTAANDRAQREAEAHFYSDPATRADFREYVARLVGHVNPYTGLRYGDDPTIMAWETGNELWTAPVAWTDDLARYLKHDLGARQLVADGSAADGMTVARAALSSPHVDIVGGHFYPVDVAWAVRDARLARAAGKAYVVGEYAWTDEKATSALLAAAEREGMAGTMYWSLIPYDESGRVVPHGDGYSMYFPATSASMASVQQVIAGHAQRMAALCRA